MSAAGGADTVPASASCSPQTSSSSVDLPQPEGPTTATISPGAAAKETSTRAGTGPPRRVAAKVRDTPLRVTSPPP